jgi:glutathione S-transferase
VKARQVIVEGTLKAKLLKLTEVLASSGGSYLTGDNITQADFSLFTHLSLLVSGFLDGVPKDLLDSYPDLKAFHNRVAALPAVTKMYVSPTSDYALSFRPL